MTKLIYSILSIFAISACCMPASGGTVLFDFNSGPQYAPLPLDLTVQGITAHFSATGQGFSIQDTAQVIGVLPTGFSGLGIVPSSVFPADLLVSFPQEQVTDFSIMVAPGISHRLNRDAEGDRVYERRIRGNDTSRGVSRSFGLPQR